MFSEWETTWLDAFLPRKHDSTWKCWVFVVEENSKTGEGQIQEKEDVNKEKNKNKNSRTSKLAEMSVPFLQMGPNCLQAKVNFTKQIKRVSYEGGDFPLWTRTEERWRNTASMPSLIYCSILFHWTGTWPQISSGLSAPGSYYPVTLVGAPNESQFVIQSWESLAPLKPTTGLNFTSRQ